MIVIPEFDMSEDKIIDSTKIAEELKQSNLPIFIWGYAVTAYVTNEKLKMLGIETTGFVTDKPGADKNGIISKETLIQNYPEYILINGFADAFKYTDEETKSMWAGCQKVYTISDCYDGIFAEDLSKDFYLEHKIEFDEVYDNLSDELSKNSMQAFIMAKVLKNHRPIIPYVVNTQYFFKPPLWHVNDHEIFFDCGAFDGDSTLDFVNFTDGNYEQIIACEPDPDNFKNLKVNLANHSIRNSVALNVGIGAERGSLKFNANQGMSSAFSNEGCLEVPIDTIDNITKSNGGGVTIIKMDIEGFELPALQGAKETIIENRPVLEISAYHKRDDIFKIYQCIKGMVQDYKFYFRLHKFNGGDSILYAIPKERSI